MNTPNNPDAFPQPIAFDLNGSCHHTVSPGMSMRDYFAAKAMSGWVASFTSPDARPIPKNVAVFAYEIADAMLAEREKKN